MRVTRRTIGFGIAALALLSVALVARPGTVLTQLHAALASPWFPFVLLGLYGVRPFLGWPITVLSALVGFRYGMVVGIPVALLGAALTSLVPYWGGRLAPESGRFLGRFTGGSRAYFQRAGGLRGVVAARLAPLPAEPVSAAAGAGNVSLPAFVLGTVIGELPWTLAAVSIGHSMATFTLDGVQPDWWVVAFALGIAFLLLVRPFYRAISARSK
jgi:uncharacterized membrane protein YdjX (TVP38/TMEM64 family)